MFGRAGEAHSVRLGKLADRGFAERKLRQHSAPRRIGKGMEHGIESIINHVVEYVRVNWNCQPFG